MTTHTSANILCKVKVKGLCLVLLCLHLVVAEVPGPCKYSVRKDHLTTVRHLIENQLKNGCSITYIFTERGNLSDTCYIKAAFPQILELIDSHFRFARSSDNGRYVEVMKDLIYDMYSQNCIPPINEEHEDDPAKFSKTHIGSPREALDRVLEVFSLYLELMSTRNTPVDWSCEDEYAKDEPQFTTPLVQTTGAAECQCFIPTLDYGVSHEVSMTDSRLWKFTLQPTDNPSFFTGAPGRDPLLRGTLDPIAAQWKTDGTNLRVGNGMDSGNKQMGGVFLPFAKSQFLRAVGAEHSTGLHSAVKKLEFPTAKESFTTESDTSSVFSEAFASAEDTPIPYRSQGGTRSMKLSVSNSDLGEHSESPALGISRDPAQSGTPKFVTDSPISHTSFESGIGIISSQVFMGHPSTPVPLQFQVERTPKRLQASVMVPLAKRSVEPQQDMSQVVPSTKPAKPRIATTSPSQLPHTISVIARVKAAAVARLDHLSRSEHTWQGLDQTSSPQTTGPSHGPKTWLGDGTGQSRGVPIPVVHPAADPDHKALSRKTARNEVVGSADELAQDKRTHFQSGDPEGSHDSNMLAYIMAPVCGGLLFISAIYCFRRQKVCFMRHRSRAAGLSINDSHV